MARQKDRPTIKKTTSKKDVTLSKAAKEKGSGKERPADIANTAKLSKKAHKPKDYTDHSKEELYAKAREMGLNGVSKKTKVELIDMLRGRW